MREETIVEGLMLMLKTRVEDEGKEGSRVSESGSQRSRSRPKEREKGRKQVGNTECLRLNPMRNEWGLGGPTWSILVQFGPF